MQKYKYFHQGEEKTNSLRLKSSDAAKPPPHLLQGVQEAVHLLNPHLAVCWVQDWSDPTVTIGLIDNQLHFKQKTEQSESKVWGAMNGLKADIVQI